MLFVDHTGNRFSSDYAYPATIADGFHVVLVSDAEHVSDGALLHDGDDVFTSDGRIFRPIVPSVGEQAFAQNDGSEFVWARRIS